MRIIYTTFLTLILFLLSACTHKDANPEDPLENINRKVFVVNQALDSAILKPTAKIYKAILPSPMQKGVNNFYNNLNMLPTMANDILQADFNFLVKDFWRFVVNTTVGIGGLFDVAEIAFNLPPHSNDLGLTFAKWGDKKSPYIVIPLLGPSTIRDGFGMLFDFTIFSPYPYINSDTIVYSLIGLRMIDLRAQMLETDKYIDEAFDKYSFMRDAYLQHRNYLITGEKEDTAGSIYVEADVGAADYIEEDEKILEDKKT